MKIRNIFLATIILCGVFSTASALRLSSQSITQFNISQTSYSEETPFDIQGKIWGNSPAGDINRILYRLQDSNQNVLWEFAEPYVKTFAVGDELDAEFRFDFSNVLISGDSILNVELQASSMNGSFTKTLAMGTLKLIFPESTEQKMKVSEITKFLPVVGENEIATSVSFLNREDNAPYAAEVKIFNKQGVEVAKKIAEAIEVATGERHDFLLNFSLPGEPGVYEAQARVLTELEPVTGVNKKEIIVEGNFGLFSSLKIVPAEFLYSGDTAKIEFSGAVSTHNDNVTVKLRVQDKAGNEVFASNEALQADSVGRFSGSASFVVPEETSELIVSSELFREKESLGRSEYRTGVYKKMMASEGQSEISFQAEKVQQEFESGGLYQKLGMILMLVVILILGGLFIWIVIRHNHAAKTLALILTLLGTFSGVEAGNIVTSNHPVQGWTVSPAASAENEMFKSFQLSGIIEVGTAGVFPVNTDITANVRILNASKIVMDSDVNGYFFKDSSIEDVDSVSQTVQTSASNIYNFPVTLDASVPDGEYALIVEFSWDNMPSYLGTNLEVHLIEGANPLTINVDNTSPIGSISYYKQDGTELKDIADPLKIVYTNDYVYVGISCADVTGCMPDAYEKFQVKGNFCSDTSKAYCYSDKVHSYEICDNVGNCSTPIVAEIEHYDPVSPTADSFSLEGETTGVMKAFESYVLDIVNLSDPATQAASLDDHACGGGDSMFFDDGDICKERYKTCAIDLISRGKINQADPDAICSNACADDMFATDWGGCQYCSDTFFPFCLSNMILQ